MFMKQNNIKVAENIVKKLRKHGVAWPELDVIEQSLNAGKLTETIK